jgi:soluble cytochrome b562
MKYFKFLGDNLNAYGPDFDIGAIYSSDYQKYAWNKVGLLAKKNPNDWQEIKKKSLSEKIEILKKQAESEGMKLEVVLEKKVKKRVKVEPNVRSIQEGFEILAKRSDKNDFLNWMSSKLEEYLNR